MRSWVCKIGWRILGSMGVRRKQRRHICLTFSGSRRCNAHGRSQNALSFLFHKENALCYGNSHKNYASLAQQCFVFGYATFRSGQFGLAVLVWAVSVWAVSVWVVSIWPIGSGPFGLGTFWSRDISVRLWNLAEILHVHFLMQCKRAYITKRFYLKKNTNMIQHPTVNQHQHVIFIIISKQIKSLSTFCN